MCDEVTKSKNVTESRECGDAVTTSPRPWRVNDKPNGQLILYASIVECSDGRRVAFVCRSSDAALIVTAVNERDRLRDIVRRLVGYCDAVTVYRPPTVEVRASDGTHEDYNGAELLREARAAIGEDKP